MIKQYVPHNFIARDYQRELLEAIFIHKYRHVFYILHRRAGKDAICFNIILALACQRIGTHLYLFPQLNQARRVIWRGINSEGKRFLDHIPECLIKKTNSTDMSVELHNGSIIQLGGSNNYDSYMGSNPVSIVYSEFPLHNPLSRQYFSPILAENHGIEILQGTPRGKNYAWNVRQACKNDKDWFFRELTVDDTKKDNGERVITEEEIDAFRRSGMSLELIRQEFYCDWNVGIQGAYFTEEMDNMESDNRIFVFDINPNAPVFTAWDLGVSDPTCIIFFQQCGEFIDIIYYYEKTDKGPDYFSRVLDEVKQKLNIKYRYHFGPHDLNQRKWGYSARSSLSLAREFGIHFLIVPDVGIDNGIQAMRAILPQVRIHKTNCGQLIDALKEYRREWDEENRVFKSKPFHNWASHPCDAFRYLAVIWRDQFVRPELSSPRIFQTNFEPKMLDLNKSQNFL